MMLNCRDASRLSSEAMDHSLPWAKRLALRLHLSMCRYCKRYADQLRFIHQIADLGGDQLSETSSASEIRLTEDAKQRIQRAMHQSNV